MQRASLEGQSTRTAKRSISLPARQRAVRQLFARGRASSPCVIFFDELDALVPKRGGDSGSQATERVVNQMLTEMDGLEGRKLVFVIAATNRPDMLDAAMMRPGRLDKLLYVPLPKPAERAAILRTAVRRMPLAPGVDLDAIASDARCSGFSGADLSSLAREAATAALRGCDPSGTPPVGQAHFERAFDHVLPSVSPKDEAGYLKIAAKLRTSRATSTAPTERTPLPDASMPEAGAAGPEEPALA